VRQQGAGHRLIAALFAVFLGIASVAGAGLLDTANDTPPVRPGPASPATRGADRQRATSVAAVPAAARMVSARFVRARHGGAWSRWHAMLQAGVALLVWALLGRRLARGRLRTDASWHAGIRPRAPPAPAFA
jgi:hypothetical protein